MDHDELQGNGRRGSSGEKREGHRRHHHHLKPKRRWIISPLWGIIFLESIVIAGLIIWCTSLRRDCSTSSAHELSLGRKLKETQAELEGLKAASQKACLSKVVPLKLEAFLDINKEYVKHAFFIVSGKNGNKILEYKFMLKNDNKINVVPKFDIVFLNKAGNEVGTVKYGYHDDGTPSEKALEMGEVRSIDGTFDISGISQPESFMVKTLDH